MKDQSTPLGTTVLTTGRNTPNIRRASIVGKVRLALDVPNVTCTYVTLPNETVLFRITKSNFLFSTFYNNYF